MMIIRGVNVYPSQVESVLVGLEGLAPHYQIRLFKEGPLDAMAVDVEVLASVGDSIQALTAKAGEVRHHIKSIIGVTCMVTAKLPGRFRARKVKPSG